MNKDSHEDPLARPQLRAAQYQHVDGTFELTFGILFLLMAVSFYGISRVVTSNSFFAVNILPYAPLVIMVGGGYLLDALAKQLRIRVTYPRSGYMDSRKPQPLERSIRLIIWIGIPLLTLALLMILFMNRARFSGQIQGEGIPFLVLPFAGLLFGGLWSIAAWKIALPRFYLLAVVSLLTGVGLFFNRVSGYDGLAAFFGVMGAALCISGGLTLFLYIRHTRSPNDEVANKKEEIK